MPFDIDGSVRQMGGKWSPVEAARRIEELEAMAVSRGLETFAPAIKGMGVDLHVDNTSVLYEL